MFDTECFILEIQASECIWNSKSPLYYNKELKRDAWIAVYNTMNDEIFEELTSEEQNEKVEDLKKKWKNIRDQFKKSRRGSTSSRIVKSYVYSDILEFLVPVIENKKADSNINEEEDSVTDPLELSFDESVIPKRSKRRQKRNTHLISIARKTKRKQIQRNKNTFKRNQMLKRLSASKTKVEEDPDKCFLFSLLPQIRVLNNDQKNFLYIEFLQSLQSAKYFQPHKQESPKYPDLGHNTFNSIQDVESK